MIKRLIDILLSALGLIFFSPILLFFMMLIWINDKKNPLYISRRVGKNDTEFFLIKLRSMVVDADKKNINSTSINDKRITRIGQKIRHYKLDELTQLWNVLLGDMSLVGPRPNVRGETDLYTIEEKKLLSVKPGITDFSSIIFSDEGKILENEKNPDLAYRQLIRPWKSRLSLIYIKHQSIFLDLRLIAYTIISLFSKNISLHLINLELNRLNVSKDIIEISKRKKKLYPSHPPGY